MTACVRRASWLKVLAARTWLANNYPLPPNPYHQIARHRCHRASDCPGLRQCLLAIAYGFSITPDQVWESLEQFGRQHGMCPVCTLRELFSERNRGAPLWLAPLLGEFYELDGTNVQLAQQIAWAALRANYCDTQRSAVRVLALAGRTTAEA